MPSHRIDKLFGAFLRRGREYRGAAKHRHQRRALITAPGALKAHGGAAACTQPPSRSADGTWPSGATRIGLRRGGGASRDANQATTATSISYEGLSRARFNASLKIRWPPAEADKADPEAPSFGGPILWRPDANNRRPQAL